MTDNTEQIRKQIIANEIPTDRQSLESQYGQVWTTEELAGDFEVLGFAAPFVVVRRRSDGRRGSLQFQHSPRFYHSFEEA